MDSILKAIPLSFVAGSASLALYLQSKGKTVNWTPNDIDVFVPLSEEDRKAHRIHTRVPDGLRMKALDWAISNGYSVSKYSPSNLILNLVKEGSVTISIISIGYGKGPEDIFNQFDLTCNMIAIDGSRTMHWPSWTPDPATMKAFYVPLDTGIIMKNHAVRMLKYMDRGFSIKIHPDRTMIKDGPYHYKSRSKP